MLTWWKKRVGAVAHHPYVAATRTALIRRGRPKSEEKVTGNLVEFSKLFPVFACINNLFMLILERRFKIVYNYILRFSDYLRLEKNASVLTVQSYSRDISQFLSFLEKEALDLAGVDYRCLRRYLAMLKEQGYARSSVARKLSAVRTFLRYMKREGQLTINSWEIVSTPKKEKKLPQFLYVDEVENLLEATDPGSLLGCRDRAVV
ncbi:MAG TPA: hypothetical protein DCQ14_04325, partial [Firmicutes bacterium]|nr:hypothetical protein [Bacillota bacterium]